MATETAIIFFLMPASSAMAPSTGESSAMMTMARVVAHAKRSVAAARGRSAATTEGK
jgi:hypothetical protein